MSSDGEGATCQRQDSIFEVEKLVDTDQNDQAFLNEHQICVELIRNADGFGLTIEGGIDRPLYTTDKGIFITGMKQGSNAQKSGHLEVGDKLLEVNGHSLINVKHEEAVKRFKESRGRVKLVIHKNIGLILEAASLSEESSDMESPSADAKELKGFSPVGFVVGIAIGCIAVLALRRHFMQR